MTTAALESRALRHAEQPFRRVYRPRWPLSGLGWAALFVAGAVVAWLMGR